MLMFNDDRARKLITEEQRVIIDVYCREFNYDCTIYNENGVVWVDKDYIGYDEDTVDAMTVKGMINYILSNLIDVYECDKEIETAKEISILKHGEVKYTVNGRIVM